MNECFERREIESVIDMLTPESQLYKVERVKVIN